jgi:hypothetical protein
MVEAAIRSTAADHPEDGTVEATSTRQSERE